MIKPKESSKKAMDLCINSGKRNILDVKYDFVSSNLLEILGFDESTRIDQKVVKNNDIGYL